MIDDLESVGAAFAERAVLEARYQGAIGTLVRSFVTETARTINVRGGAVTSFEALAIFNSVAASLASSLGLPDEIVKAIRESPLPARLSAAATSALQEAAALGMSTSESAELVWSRLGLSKDSPGKLEIVKKTRTPVLDLPSTEVESSFSWEKYGDGLARGFSTEDFAKEMISELEAEGYPLKRWSTRSDDRVRHAHVMADTQTVPLSEPFQVGGHFLAYPGDPTGPPDLIDGCRCVIVGVRDGERDWDFPPGIEPWNDAYPGT